MIDFVSNIQDYLDTAESAASTPPCEFSYPLSPPYPSTNASSASSSAHRLHPSVSNLPPPAPSSGYVAPPLCVSPGSNPNWSAVGGYDHPQPGSRLLQYGALHCTLYYTVFTIEEKAYYQIVRNTVTNCHYLVLLLLLFPLPLPLSLLFFFWGWLFTMIVSL